MRSPGLNELRDGARAWQGFYRGMARKASARRTVLRAGTLLALAGSGSLNAFLAACSGDEPTGGAASTAGGTSVSGGSGITGDWDSTGTPPYKNGLSDEVAQVPEQWKQSPWVYKYGPWRYNWDIPVTRGGHVIVPQGPAADYNVMISGILAQPVYNKLYNAGLREGLDLLTAAIEPDLVIGEEHSADYTSWTFKIPENATFHNLPPVNGRLLTADDVVFSFERHMDTSVNRSVLRNVERVTAPDKTTVRFDLKQPQLTFPGTLASPHLVVFAPEAFANQDQFKQKPVGTGAFQLEFSEYQNRADFVRHPESWQLPPYKPEKYGQSPLPLVDKYTRQYFANNVAAKEAFFAGKVDQLAPGGGLDTALVREQLQQVPNAIVMTNAYWSCCPLGIFFQYRNPLFQDPRVRQALSMSINREQVWSGGMDKGGLIGATPIPPDFAGYDLPPALSDYGANAQYDPKKAKQLLEAAGYREPIKFQIYQGPNQPTAWQGALDTVVFNWKQAGVADASLVVRDSQVLTQDQVNKSFPDTFFSIGGLALGYTLDSLVAPVFLKDAPRNFGSVADADLENMLNQWSVTTSPDEGVKLARQMTDRIVDQVDHLWFGWIGGIEVDQPWLHGMVMSTHNQPNGIGLGNYKYVWIDGSAPDGRGGRPV
ncbi:MAG: ABC transporter substrate-binding protein [Dehalococcoidia bacterium]